MASSLFPDPLQMWREAVTKLENDANTLASGSMKSPEVARSLQQASAVTMGMQQVFEKMVEAYLRRSNLPSRKELLEVMESLQRIEEKIDRLLPQDTSVPKPARTRRPQSAVAPSQDVPPPAPATAAAKPAATKSTKRRSKT